jgi:hypothetical protein
MKFLDAAQTGRIKRTSEGYLIADAKAMRTGVQLYSASELGLMGNHTVRVMRPVDSVRNPESLASMSHAPVTLGHPEDGVDSENWKDLAVGEVSTSATWDGDFISLPLILKDKAAIDAVEAGTSELSAGYVADMIEVDHPDYDFIMGPPRYNHLAIVDKARAGHEARIGDGTGKPWGAAPQLDQERTSKVDMIKVMVGDKAVQVAAADADLIANMVKDHAKALEAKDTQIAELKIECADTAKKVVSDEEIAQRIADGVKEISAVTEKAVKLVKDYDSTGKDAMTIRREVIQAVYGDEAIADLKTDAEIKAAFAVAQPEIKADPVKAALGDAKPKEEKGPWDGMYKAKKEDK